MSRAEGGTMSSAKPLRSLPPGLIAVPAVDWMWTKSATALVAIAGGGLPPGSGISFNGGCSVIARSRNILVERFLEQKQLEWLLFLDSDMVPPIDVVPRLLAHGVDVVGALCFARQAPFWPAFRALTPESPGLGLQVVQWVGTGCLLVSRRALEAVPAPQFEHPEPGVGEDVLFCEKLSRRGFRIHVDMSTEVGHMASQPVTASVAHAFNQSPDGQAALLRSAHTLSQPAFQQLRERIAEMAGAGGAR
jgi:hypothetical protein